MTDSVNFLLEKNRFDTFKNWQFSDKHQCSARKMAEAGFIFIGSRNEPDLAKCFFCNKELDGWEKDDDPWKEHVNHSAHCKFAVRQIPENEMTVSQFLDIANAFGEKLIENSFNKRLDLLEKINASVREYFVQN